MFNIFRFRDRIREIWLNQTGVTSIEYGLIAVAVATMVVAILYGNPDGFILAVTKKMDQLASLVHSAILTL